ncbi:MAG: hypothetical protein UW20_C0005G0048 [Candidatus Woesebacteria bacterium GW2011_GWB1_44_11]|uniref:Uncharacterized protein n=1 Tax=Candidatus Woesebacteria bacterium GW2011_GWB1_44_11 TaxID=1618579 RepID=A0A837I664_9BACT|nr:MAG: hypothetical protein UW20_C0005G0048 [Candidatus Woesebacteria bacterium GW2011_GWB1_44_11]
MYTVDPNILGTRLALEVPDLIPKLARQGSSKQSGETYDTFLGHYLLYQQNDQTLCLHFFLLSER